MLFHKEILYRLRNYNSFHPIVAVFALALFWQCGGVQPASLTASNPQNSTNTQPEVVRQQLEFTGNTLNKGLNQIKKINTYEESKERVFKKTD